MSSDRFNYWRNGQQARQNNWHSKSQPWDVNWSYHGTNHYRQRTWNGERQFFVPNGRQNFTPEGNANNPRTADLGAARFGDKNFGCNWNGTTNQGSNIRVNDGGNASVETTTSIGLGGNNSNQSAKNNPDINRKRQKDSSESNINGNKKTKLDSDIQKSNIPSEKQPLDNKQKSNNNHSDVGKDIKWKNKMKNKKLKYKDSSVQGMDSKSPKDNKNAKLLSKGTINSSLLGVSARINSNFQNVSKNSQSGLKSSTASQNSASIHSKNNSSSVKSSTTADPVAPIVFCKSPVRVQQSDALRSIARAALAVKTSPVRAVPPGSGLDVEKGVAASSATSSPTSVTRQDLLRSIAAPRSRRDLLHLNMLVHAHNLVQRPRTSVRTSSQSGDESDPSGTKCSESGDPGMNEQVEILNAEESDCDSFLVTEDMISGGMCLGGSGDNIMDLTVVINDDSNENFCITESMVLGISSNGSIDGSRVAHSKKSQVNSTARMTPLCLSSSPSLVSLKTPTQLSSSKSNSFKSSSSQALAKSTAASARSDATSARRLPTLTSSMSSPATGKQSLSSINASSSKANTHTTSCEQSSRMSPLSNVTKKQSSGLSASSTSKVNHGTCEKYTVTKSDAKSTGSLYNKKALVSSDVSLTDKLIGPDSDRDVSMSKSVRTSSKSLVASSNAQDLNLYKGLEARDVEDNEKTDLMGASDEEDVSSNEDSEPDYIKRGVKNPLKELMRLSQVEEKICKSIATVDMNISDLERSVAVINIQIQALKKNRKSMMIHGSKVRRRRLKLLKASLNQASSSSADSGFTPNSSSSSNTSRVVFIPSHCRASDPVNSSGTVATVSAASCTTVTSHTSRTTAVEKNKSRPSGTSNDTPTDVLETLAAAAVLCSEGILTSHSTDGGVRDENPTDIERATGARSDQDLSRSTVVSVNNKGRRSNSIKEDSNHYICRDPDLQICASMVDDMEETLVKTEKNIAPSTNKSAESFHSGNRVNSKDIERVTSDTGVNRVNSEDIERVTSDTGGNRVNSEDIERVTSDTSVNTMYSTDSVYLTPPVEYTSAEMSGVSIELNFCSIPSANLASNSDASVRNSTTADVSIDSRADVGTARTTVAWSGISSMDNICCTSSSCTETNISSGANVCSLSDVRMMSNISSSSMSNLISDRNRTNDMTMSNEETQLPLYDSQSLGITAPENINMSKVINIEPQELEDGESSAEPISYNMFNNANSWPGITLSLSEPESRISNGMNVDCNSHSMDTEIIESTAQHPVHTSSVIQPFSVLPSSISLSSLSDLRCVSLENGVTVTFSTLEEEDVTSNTGSSQNSSGASDISGIIGVTSGGSLVQNSGDIILRRSNTGSVSSGGEVFTQSSGNSDSRNTVASRNLSEMRSEEALRQSLQISGAVNKNSTRLFLSALSNNLAKSGTSGTRRLNKILSTSYARLNSDSGSTVRNFPPNISNTRKISESSSNMCIAADEAAVPSAVEGSAAAVEGAAAAVESAAAVEGSSAAVEGSSAAVEGAAAAVEGTAAVVFTAAHTANPASMSKSIKSYVVGDCVVESSSTGSDSGASIVRKRDVVSNSDREHFLKLLCSTSASNNSHNSVASVNSIQTHASTESSTANQPIAACRNDSGRKGTPSVREILTISRLNNATATTGNSNTTSNNNIDRTSAAAASNNNTTTSGNNNSRSSSTSVDNKDSIVSKTSSNVRHETVPRSNKLTNSSSVTLSKDRPVCVSGDVTSEIEDVELFSLDGAWDSRVSKAFSRASVYLSTTGTLPSPPDPVSQPLTGGSSDSTSRSTSDSSLYVATNPTSGRTNAASTNSPSGKKAGKAQAKSKAAGVNDTEKCSPTKRTRPNKKVEAKSSCNKLIM